ncbi:MAG: hypothetical protein ACHP65_00160 [Legionellales bacterium]
MKSPLRCMLVLLSLLSLSTITLAATNNEIRTWDKKVLLETLSVSDTLKTGELAKKVSAYYTHNAWHAVVNFLGVHMDAVHQQHLTLHPIFNAEPTIVESGVLLGFNYWRVNQTVSIPELDCIIDFSLLIHTVKSTVSGSPYIIQSMNIKIRHDR